MTFNHYYSDSSYTVAPSVESPYTFSWCAFTSTSRRNGWRTSPGRGDDICDTYGEEHLCARSLSISPACPVFRLCVTCAVHESVSPQFYRLRLFAFARTDHSLFVILRSASHCYQLLPITHQVFVLLN